MILSAAEQNGADQIADARAGWDHETLTGEGQQRRYFFDVPAGATDGKLAATLTWLRRVELAGTTLTATLSRLELRLFETDANLNLGALVDSSLSPIDNVQHLYADVTPGGRYALEVTLADLPDGQLSEDFAVAWQARFVPVPEPGGLALAGLVAVGVIWGRVRGRGRR